jgi:hypothetical protein
METIYFELDRYIVTCSLMRGAETDLIAILSKKDELNQLEEKALEEELSKLGCTNISISYT